MEGKELKGNTEVATGQPTLNTRSPCPQGCGEPFLAVWLFAVVSLPSPTLVLDGYPVLPMNVLEHHP